jgi:hypothetical protein
MPDNMKRALTPPANIESLVPAPPPAPPLPPVPDTNRPFRYNALSVSPAPSQISTAPDQLQQWVRPGMSQYRIWPPQAQSSQAVGAQIQSHVEAAVEAAAPVFQVNNRPNPIQGTLNLTGSGVSYGPGPGQVQIDTGDGLIHGDPVWELDPGFVLLRDDFVTGNATQATGGGSAIGDLKWDFGGNGTPASTRKFLNAGPAMGVLQIQREITANTWSALMLPLAFSSANDASMQGGTALLDYPSWRMIWIFQLRPPTNPVSNAFSATKTSLYIGLSCPASYSSWNPNSSCVRPPYFVGLRFDTDATSPAIGDSTFHYEAVANPNFSSVGRDNTQGNVFDTGVAPVDGQWYRFEMLYTATGTVQMSLTPGAASYTEITVPQMVCAQSGGSGFSFASGNGYAEVIQSSPASSITNNFVFASGTQMTIAGVTGSKNTHWNTTFPVTECSQGNNAFFSGPGVSGTDSAFVPAAGTTITAYSAVVPALLFGTDSHASPVGLTLNLDFFGFVWNPGVNTSNALTPSSSLPRYW